MLTVHWTPRAQSDLFRIHRRIAADNPSAADKLIGHFMLRARWLREWPFMGRVREDGKLFRLVVHDNYQLSYRVTAEDVHIVRVLHVARGL